MARGWWLVAPGVEAFARSDGRTVRCRLSRRGELPLGLGGQSTSGPPAVGLGLVPVDVDDGLVGRYGLYLIKPAVIPAVASFRPVDRVLGGDGATPHPALVAPELAALVAAIVHERGKLRVGDGAARHLEGGDLDAVGPLFVVEDEGEVGGRTAHELSAGDAGVALQGTAKLAVEERRVIIGDGWGRKAVGVAGGGGGGSLP